MKSTYAQCAAQIRKELKAAFPKVKFYVVSEGFTGGDAVRISWFDGPKYSTVDAIVKKYQYGHFDSMSDGYEYSNKIEGLSQVKFVQTTRRMSPETQAAVIAEMGITATQWNQNNEAAGEYNSQIGYRRFQQMEFNVEPEAVALAAEEVPAAAETAPEGYTPQQVSECHDSNPYSGKRPFFFLDQEQVKVIDWAVSKGYLKRLSHSQIAWTQAGVDWYRANVFGVIALECVQIGKAKEMDCTVSGGCMICGRKIEEPTKYSVHLLASGLLIASDFHFGAEDQGFFPIGADCAKKIGKFALKAN